MSSTAEVNDLRTLLAEQRSMRTHATAILGDLETQYDRFERGEGSLVAVEDALGAVASDTFLELQTYHYEALIERLRETFDQQPDALTDPLVDIYHNHNKSAFESQLSTVERSFPPDPPDDVRRTFEGLRAHLQAAFRREDDDEFYDPFESLHDLLVNTGASPFFVVLADIESTLNSARAEYEDLLHALTAAYEDEDVDENDELDELVDELSAELADDAKLVLHTRIRQLGEAFENVREGDSERLTVVRDALDTLWADVHAGTDAIAETKADLDIEKSRLFDTLGDDISTPHNLLDAADRPVLLLPVRLETRFDDATLQVRVYPDDVHVDFHDPELTRDELTWGIHFWSHVWWAAHATANPERIVADTDFADTLEDVPFDSLPTDYDDRYDAVVERVWTELVEAFGETRAAWVKRELAPSNAEQLLTGPHAPSEIPELSREALTNGVRRRPESSNKPPEARLLPDRWVAFVQFDDGGKTTVVADEPIREPLAVGPDPMAGTPDGPMAWMADYTEAKAAGMALDVELPTDDTNVDELVVLGVKSTMTPGTTADAVTDLFDAHHYTDGLAFLPQETATNNTEEASGFSSADDAEGSLPVECDPSLVESGTDGDHAATMLGLSPSVFAHVAGADGTDERDATNLNAALWGATWGYFIPHMLAPDDWVGTAKTQSGPDPDDLLEWLVSYREHFVDYVRANPLPALRVGRQPYGVLPATTLTENRWQDEVWTNTDDWLSFDVLPHEVEPRDVESDLVQKIRSLRQVWDRSVSNVPHVSDVDSNVGSELLDLLSMAPSAFDYESRSLVGVRTYVKLFTDRFDLDIEDERIEDGLVTFFENLVQDLVGSQAITDLEAAFGGGLPLPRIARLLFMSDPTRPVEPLATDTIGTFTGELLDESLAALWMDAPGESIFQIIPTMPDGSTIPFEEVGMESLFHALLYYALIQEYVLGRIRLCDVDYFELDIDEDHPQSWFKQRVWQLLPERERYQSGDETALDLLTEEIYNMLVQKHDDIETGDSFADVLRKAIDVPSDSPEIDRRFRSFGESLQYVQDSDFSEAEAERLLRGTLDLATHRFDAWETSVATKRLAALREERDGLYVGACGWVTDLESRTGDNTDGYVHAPSLPQATTGAILRSGHQTNNGARRDALAVDLSPRRVRLAKNLLDGVRNGQPLGALLGYRFERDLHEHDRDLDRYVFEFRKLDPTAEGAARDDGKPEPAIATRDVVDGLALYRRLVGERLGIPWGETVLDSSTHELPVEDSLDGEAIGEALNTLEASVDALQDVLTAEGVHQLVNGRPMKSGASLDALARGETPPELDVTETPRSGVATTHRLFVTFDDLPAAGTSPRAQAEPRLDAWVGGLLPDPTAVVCAVEYETDPESPSLVTLADLDLAPIDVLAVPEGDVDAQRSELEERVRYYYLREIADELGGSTSSGTTSGSGTAEANESESTDPEMRLLFAPVASWEYDAADFDGTDPSDLVSFGELLEVVRSVRELVAGSRPATARDFLLPTDGGGDRLDLTELRTRASAATDALADARSDLADGIDYFTQTDDETVSEFDGVAALGPALVGLDESDRASIERLSTFDDLDPNDVVRAANTLLSRLQDRTLIPTDDNGMVSLPRGEPVLIGATTAVEPGEEVTVRLMSQEPPFLTTARAEVHEDGRFKVNLDLEELEPDTEFEVVIRIDDGELRRLSGRVVEDERERRYDSFVRSELLAGLTDAAGVPDAAADVTADLRAAASAAPLDALTVDDHWRRELSSSERALADDILELRTVDLSPSGWHEIEVMGEIVAALRTMQRAGKVPPLFEITRRLTDVVSELDQDIVENAFNGLLDAHSDLLDAIDAGDDGVAAIQHGMVELLRTALLAAAGLGVYGSVPQSPIGESEVDRQALVRQARAALATLDERRNALPLDSTGAISDDATADELLACVEGVFEESFVVLPPFTPANRDELARTFGASETLQNSDPTAVETWLQRAARVREHPDLLRRVFTYASALGDGGLPGDTPRLIVGQLPHHPDVDWVGLPDAWTDPEGGRLSLIAHDATTFVADGTNSGTGGGTGSSSATMAGLFVDEWIESIPADEETTGLSFHHERPSNRAPQSMVLAVPPNDDGWSLAGLKAVVAETQESAKRRLVDTESMEDFGHFLPALAAAHNSGGSWTIPDAPSMKPRDFDGDGGDA